MKNKRLPTSRLVITPFICMYIFEQSHRNNIQIIYFLFSGLWFVFLRVSSLFLVKIPSIRRGSKPQMPRSILCPQMSYWPVAFEHGVMHVFKVSQIMASNRSLHHKMTNSGERGFSVMLPGKFPIKTLIQAVREVFWLPVSVFPSLLFQIQLFFERSLLHCEITHNNEIHK